MKIEKIYEFLCDFAPLRYAMEFDNVGLLFGDGAGDVSRVLVSLDPSSEAIDEAASLGCGLIVTHHPLIRKGVVTRITSENPLGRRLLRLGSERIAVISMHTNMDAAEGGVNDCLASALGLRGVEMFPNCDAREGVPSIGRIGTVEPCAVDEFAARAAELLDCPGVQYVRANGRCEKIAVGGGTCGDYIPDALAAGCDTLVTADVKYHQFRDAVDLGLNVIDCGHYPTENTVVKPLAARLSGAFPDVEFVISKKNVDPRVFIAR